MGRGVVDSGTTLSQGGDRRQDRVAPWPWLGEIFDFETDIECKATAEDPRPIAIYQGVSTRISVRVFRGDPQWDGPIYLKLSIRRTRVQARILITDSRL